MRKLSAKYYKEIITHFSCGDCGKWWTIGDALKNKTTWHCPWCGKLQKFLKKAKKL